MENVNSLKIKIKFTSLIKTFLFIAFLVGIFCTGYSLYTAYRLISDDIARLLASVFSTLLFIFLTVLLFGILFFSYYVTEGKFLITKLGLVKIKIEIPSITAAVYVTDKKKFILTYGRKKECTVIMIPEDKQDEFMAALREINPKIIYDKKTAENI